MLSTSRGMPSHAGRVRKLPYSHGLTGRVGSGRVGRFPKSHGSGRSTHTRPDSTSPRGLTRPVNIPARKTPPTFTNSHVAYLLLFYRLIYWCSDGNQTLLKLPPPGLCWRARGGGGEHRGARSRRRSGRGTARWRGAQRPDAGQETEQVTRGL